MQHNESVSSLEDRLESQGSAEAGRWVPVCSRQVFHALAEAAIRFAVKDGRKDLVCSADSQTANLLLAPFLPHAGRVHLYGHAAELLSASVESPGLITYAKSSPPDERFLAFSGGDFCFVVRGRMVDNAGDAAPDCVAAWTTEPTLVREYLNRLLGAPAPSQTFAPDGPHATTLALAAIHAEMLSAGRRHVARDRADLRSVLEILKSISTRRRAHDVLYVFVEQVARVVPAMRRCSVVRIWGNQRTGLVLASHEDPTVQEQSIDLEKYPELALSMESGESVVIPDIAQHPVTLPHAEALRKAQIASLVVIPVVLFDEEIGSLLLRAARSQDSFRPHEISFLQIAAEAASSALERAQLFDNIQRANERLSRLARTDALTGLYNYRHFRDRLEEEYARAKRYGSPLSLMIFDVDNFKSINDSHGHLAGDAVLRAVAERTLNCIRTLDLVARYGGEEFAVIMPETDARGAATEAERLREAISSKTFDIGEAVRLSVSVSLGIAQLDQTSIPSADGLIHAADAALYQAKHAGKNRVVVSTGTP